MQGIKIKGGNHLQQGSPESCPPNRKWSMRSGLANSPKMFHLVLLLIVPDVYSSLQSLPEPLSYTLGLSIMSLRGDGFSNLYPLPAARPGCPVPPVVEGWHLDDSLFTPFNGRRAVDEDTWELIRGLGYFGSSLSSWMGLSPVNLLCSEDFS